MSDNSRPTILLAEDEASVRRLVRKIFERAGYSVLVAEDGHQALQIANEHRGDINLLVADIQMPRMTGPDLARELRRSRPNLRVMLMSGYPEGVLDTGWTFLQKPFPAEAVLDKVKQVLNTALPADTFSG
jgi:CheY-like chemotaxis protein